MTGQRSVPYGTGRRSHEAPRAGAAHGLVWLAPPWSRCVGSDRPDMETIFNAALDLTDAKERRAYLDDTCGGDRDLRERVEALLTAHEQAGDFLDPGKLDKAAVEGIGEIAEQPGTIVGRYKLLELIGEGGFGSVYMAEQTEPVRRKVALKIIKLGMDTKQVIARFEVERQALAMMDHPNIARVFDAGATDTGRPYFVMELVKGVSITQFCDRDLLTLRERLELFLPVCRAVQHAHQKGIIHRDLKPSNVLVTLHDDAPVSKIIDFGIAKATNQRLTEKTLFTGFRQFIGTPEYMSPDQACLSGLDVDTRTDVYSLGVLLYELLTGRTPFDASALRRAGYAEIQRIIREVDPPKPSTRLSTIGEGLGDIARHRRTEPDMLAKCVHGDLDWIVMKAMEKDRSRRYDTANEFADDVTRYLANEPVQATPPRAGYRLGKFVRRHRTGVLAGSIVAVALLGGLSLAIVGYVQANRARVELQAERDAAERAREAEQTQRKVAETNADTAEREARSAEAVAAFLREMLASVDPDRMLGRDVTMRFVLDEAGERISSGALADQPGVEADIRMTLGETFESLGEYAEAETHMRAAQDIRARELGPEDPRTLLAGYALAGILRERGDYGRADALFRQLVDVQRRVLGAEHHDTLASMNGLGVALWRQGRYVEAEQILKKALEAQRRIFGEENRDTVRSMVNLGTALLHQGRLGEAEQLYREAMVLDRVLLGDEHPDLMPVINNLGLVMERQGKLSEAEKLFRRGWELDARILGPDHPQSRIPMGNLIRVLESRGKSEEVAELMQQQIALLKAATERADTDASALNAYAWRLLTVKPESLRDPMAAWPVAKRAVEMDGERDALILDTLARALWMAGDLDGAIEVQRKAVARASDPKDRAGLREQLSLYYLENGDAAEAVGSGLAGIVDWWRQSPTVALSTLTSPFSGEAALGRGAYAEAESQLRLVLQRQRDVLPHDAWVIARTESLLGRALAGQKRFSEAEPFLLVGCERLWGDEGAPPEYSHEATKYLIELYEATGKPNLAAEWRAKLSKLKKADR